jgi:hypothetical protein
MGRPWREKFQDLCNEIAAHFHQHPERRVAVRPRRVSDPKVVPSDWWSDEQQVLLPRKPMYCKGCLGEIVPGTGPLWPGELCGTCHYNSRPRSRDHTA